MILYSPEYLRTLMEDRNLRRVAERAGVAYATVQQLSSGHSTNPTADTLQKLTDYFEAQQNGPITKSN